MSATRVRNARAESPHDFFQAIAKAGFLGVAIFERYGGSDPCISEVALVLREVTASGAALAERLARA